MMYRVLRLTIFNGYFVCVFQIYCFGTRRSVSTALLIDRDSFSKSSSSSMSPAVDPSVRDIPDAPPPPPLPTIKANSLPASPSRTPTPANPAVDSLKMPSLDTGSTGAGYIKRQSSFTSLLQKFTTDQNFVSDWLDLHDDEDAHSVVSVDSVSSSISGTLSRHGSIIDLKDLGATKSSTPSAAGAASAAGASGAGQLTAASVAQLEKKMDNLKVDHPRNKLSQAMIWTWLTTSKNPLPEDDSVVLSPRISADGKVDNNGKEVKIDTEKLRAKLKKTYPKKYYRDLNVTSPTNW